MKKVTFHDFFKYYSGYYETNEIIIRTELDMQEVLYELYNTDDYEINYDEKTIELY